MILSSRGISCELAFINMTFNKKICGSFPRRKINGLRAGYIYLCLCLCLCLYLCIYFYVYIYTCVYVFVCVFVCLRVCVSVSINYDLYLFAISL